MNEHVIWQNDDLDLDDWREDLLEYEPDLTEDQLYDRMIETNSDYLDDERANLSHCKRISDLILIVADLGLWDGRHQGYKLKKWNINDCLSCDSDGLYRWYVDDKGEFRCRFCHHDGTSYYRYRGIRPGVSQQRIENLVSKIYNGEPYEDLLRKLTFRLGDLIGDIYGWKFPRRPKVTMCK